MGLWTWWQQQKAKSKLKKSAKPFFEFWWRKYKDIDCPERDVLINYNTAQHGGIKQAELLWGQGYRHGDHILAYDPCGLFTEEVMTKFYDEPLLMPPDMAAKFEEAQGISVKPEDRTRRKSQPDFTSHETSLSDLIDHYIYHLNG
jgi:hypothetical protein